MATISGEIVTDGPEQDGDEEDGRPFEEFTLADREIHFAEPTKGQMLIVLGMVDVLDEEDVKLQLEAVNHFGVVIKSLFTRESDRRWVYRNLATGALDLPDWFELAMAMVQQWAPEEATNREERRQKKPANAPVAKRAARPPAARGGRR